MTRAHETASIRLLIEVSMPAVDALPPRQRADAYEGIAVVTKRHAPDLAQAATQIALHLRNTELMQGHFLNLLKDA